ncbi:hypothetical protein PSHT_09375 [Puccinia striiformis]|uniref:Uncharacterized protein n=1 Tax=Puccinia striiformis TaxID=27350 RepID=A0A2S4VHA0_9BASI|nr:hypothetical protein PSHT_09375 [Puccinia striiformis]
MRHCQQQCVQHKAMVNKLKKRKWARFNGEPQWIRCFAHVLNLIVQGILQPFGTQKKSMAPNKTRTAPDESDDSSSEGSEAGDVEEQVPELTQAGDDSSLDNEEDGSGHKVEQNNQEETVFLSLENIENASDKEEFDTYTTIGCKQALAKVSQSSHLSQQDQIIPDITSCNGGPILYYAIFAL